MVRALLILVCWATTLHAEEIIWQPSPGPDGRAPAQTPAAAPPTCNSPETNWKPASSSPIKPAPEDFTWKASQTVDPEPRPTHASPLPLFEADHPPQIAWHVEAAPILAPEPIPVYWQIDLERLAALKKSLAIPVEPPLPPRQALTVTFQPLPDVAPTVRPVRPVQSTSNLYIVSPPSSPYNPTTK